MSDHKIKPKRTTTSGAAGVPTTSNLEAGEIAINLADKKLFVRDTSSNILELTTRTIESLDNTTISSPATGEVLTYNAGSSKWENSGSTAAVWETTEHIATAGQTAFSADYTVGSLDVFLNGIRLDATDYTASSGTLVTLDTGAAAGDTVYISSYSISAGGLPSQSGNTGKYLTTDGTTATWASVAADTNNYVDSLAFSTSTGVLTVGRSGTLGDLTVDLDGKYAESSHTHNSVKIRDARADGDKTPNDYPGQQATFEFSDDLVGGPGSWESAITMKGWSDNYRVWQLRADSTTGTGDQNLWFRTGSGTSWETTDKLWTSGNLTPLVIGTSATTAAAGNHNHDSDYLELIPNTIAMGSDYSTGYTNSRITMIASQSNYRGAGVFVHNTASDYEWFYGMPYSANGNAFAICSKYTTAHDDATADKANAEFIIDQNGNVGIGTSTPSEKLEVVGADSAADISWAGSFKQGNNPGTFTTEYGVGVKFKLGAAGEENKWGGISAISETAFSNSSALALYSNEAEAMRITSSGNVGIGTVSPSSKLEVSSNTRDVLTLTNTSNAASVGIEFNDHTGGTQKGYFYGNHSDSTSGTPAAGYAFHFTSSEATTNVVLENGGSFIGDSLEVSAINTGTQSADGSRDVFLFNDGGIGNAQNGAFHSKLRILGGSDQSRDLQLYQVDSGYATIDSSWNLNQLHIGSNFTKVKFNQDVDVTGSVTATSFIGSGSSLTGIFADKGNAPTNLNDAGMGVWRINNSHTNQPGSNYGTLVSFDNIADTGFQLAANYQSDQMYFRGGNSSVYGGSGSFGAWRKIWHDGNDGSGSGLDADTLAGTSGSSFLHKTAGNQTINGTHGSARLQIKRTDTANEGQKAYLSMWASEPGITYDGAGIGGNIANAGFYYGVENTAQMGALMRFYQGKIEFKTLPAVYGAGNAGTRTFFIDSNGNSTASGTFSATSDKRLKSDIKTITNPLDKVIALRGVTFYKDGAFGTGLIAQETEEVLPEVVLTADDEMGTKSVAYGNMVGLLIEAIKEQQVQIEELKEKIK